MLGATLATVHGATEDTLHSALAGTIAFNVAGERAADLPHNGPASYRINFLDSVFGMRDTDAADLDVADRIE
jgi:hydroxyethylthiazole kinase